MYINVFLLCILNVTPPTAVSAGDLSEGVGNLAAEILPAELRYVLR